MKKAKQLCQNINMMLHEINEMVINEESQPLETFIYLKRVEKLFNEVFKGIQKDAIEQAFKTGGTFQEHNAEIQCVNGGKMFDFKGCPSWTQKNAELKGVEANLKHAFQLYEQGKHMLDDATGEINEEIPTVTYRADSIKIKLFDE